LSPHLARLLADLHAGVGHVVNVVVRDRQPPHVVGHDEHPVGVMVAASRGVVVPHGDVNALLVLRGVAPAAVVDVNAVGGNVVKAVCFDVASVGVKEFQRMPARVAVRALLKRELANMSRVDHARRLLAAHDLRCLGHVHAMF